MNAVKAIGRERHDSAAQASPRFLLTLLILLLLPWALFASAPQWWTDRGILNNSPANDYAAINQGQLKNLAVQAYAHFQTNLPASVLTNGVGTNLTTLITTFRSNTNTPYNYSAVNLGQLKTVAKPFYDILNSIGYTNAAVASPYPWSNASTPANDYAMANIGQAKNLFSFDLTGFTTTPPPDYSVPPTAPTGLTISSVSPTELQLNWTNTATNATSILVQQQNADGSWTTLVTLTPTATSYLLSGATTGQDIVLRVTTSNPAGGSSSAPSDPAHPKPTPRYAIIDLGARTLEGPQARLIANNGIVMGFTCTDDSTELLDVCRWKNGTWEYSNLDIVDTFSRIVPWMNKKGTIVFSHYASTGDNWDAQGVLWTSDQGMQFMEAAGYWSQDNKRSDRFVWLGLITDNGTIYGEQSYGPADRSTFSTQAGRLAPNMTYILAASDAGYIDYSVNDVDFHSEYKLNGVPLPFEACFLNNSGVLVGNNETSAVWCDSKDMVVHTLGSGNPYVINNRTYQPPEGGNSLPDYQILGCHNEESVIWEKKRDAQGRPTEDYIPYKISELVPENSEWSNDIGLGDISDNGLILGSTLNKTDNALHKVILLPIEVDYITRDPETGEFLNLGGLVDKSDPRPEIQFTNVQASFLGSGELEITVGGTARDFLSEFLSGGTGAPSSIELFVNGESVGTINGLTAGSSGVSPLEPWQHNDSTKNFSKTLRLSGVSPGIQTFVAKTNPNALGQRGWATASILVEKIQHGDIFASNTPAVTFSISQNLTTTTLDSITLVLSGTQSATLTEPDGQNGSSVFVGTTTIGGTLCQVRAMLPSSLTLNASATDTFSAQVSYADSAGRVYTIEGAFVETGASTRQFACSSPIATVESYENLQVAGISIGEGQKGRAFQPVGIRVTLPENLADWVKQNGWLKTELNGTEVELKPQNGVTPGDEPPAGMKYFYITASNKPKIYLPYDSLIGDTYPPEVAADGQFKLTFKNRNDGTLVYESDASIGDFAPLNEDEQVASSSQPMSLLHRLLATMIATEDGGGVQAESSDYSLDDVMLQYNFGFEKMGIDLLKLYQDAGVQVEITSWFGLSTYSFENIRPASWQQTPKILINRRRCKTEADAAVAIYNALQDLHNKSAIVLRPSLDPDMLNWEQTIASNLAGDPDAGDMAQAWRQGRLTPIKDTLVGFTETVKIGMSFTIVGNAVVTTSDTADYISEGNTVGAAVVVGSLFVPNVFGKMFKYCKRTGTTWICRFSGNITIEFTKEMLDALRHLSANATVAQKFEALRPLIDAGQISDAKLYQMWRSGFLKSEYPRAALANNLGDKTVMWLKGYVAHHDYTVASELEFIKRGIDINAGKDSGRWLPKWFHGQLTNGKGWPTSGKGGPWEYQWQKFFNEVENPTIEQIEAFRDTLRSRTSDFTKTADQINWPYPKP